MRQYRFVHIGVAALMTAATISAVGLVQTAGASGTGTASVFVPVVPCRLADTRPGPTNVGPRATPIGAAESVTFAVWGSNGNCTIPSTATGIASNVTAVNPSVGSFVTIYPSDSNPRPTASNLNVVAGGPPTPNQVTVGLSAAGAISAYNSGGTLDLIIDIVGYYTPAPSGTSIVLVNDDRYYTKVDSDGRFAVTTHTHDGRYAAVVHNHDDRYYTKAQTDAVVATADDSLRTDKYGTYALQTFQPIVQQFLPVAGSCITNSSGGSSFYTVPFTVPVGARLISLDVATYDGAGTAMVVQLVKQTLISTALNESSLASGGGGSGPAAVDHDILVPPVTEIVGADESFYVSLNNLTAGNGFCQLSVTYDTDG